MFAPITFRFRSLCSYCGGSIQPGTTGERDKGRKLNHCPACTLSLCLIREVVFNGEKDEESTR